MAPVVESCCLIWCRLVRSRDVRSRDFSAPCRFTILSAVFVFENYRLRPWPLENTKKDRDTESGQEVQLVENEGNWKGGLQL